MKHTNIMMQITVDMPFRSAGNIICSKAIYFEITRKEEFYKAMPVCPEQDKALFGLPGELYFKYYKGKLLRANNTEKRYLPMIANISGAMTDKDLFF